MDDSWEAGVEREKGGSLLASDSTSACFGGVHVEEVVVDIKNERTITSDRFYWVKVTKDPRKTCCWTKE